MKKFICPLNCNSTPVIKNKIKAKDIKMIYKKKFRINIENEILNIDNYELYYCPDCELEFFYPRTPGTKNFYKELNRYEWYYLIDKNEYDYTKKFVNKGDFVLDIGCGKGSFSLKIPDANYTGLEITDQELGYKNIKIINETIEKHAIKNKNKYEVVCAFQLLEHIDNIFSFIENALICLKNNGYFVISVPNNNSFVSLECNAVLNMPPHHLNRFNANSLQKIAQIFGLEIINIYEEDLQPIHYIPYLMVFFNNIFYNKKRIIDTSFRYNIFEKFFRFISHYLRAGFNQSYLLPKGHSITAVYKKKP